MRQNRAMQRRFTEVCAYVDVCPEVEQEPDEFGVIMRGGFRNGRISNVERLFWTQEIFGALHTGVYQRWVACQHGFDAGDVTQASRDQDAHFLRKVIRV